MSKILLVEDNPDAVKRIIRYINKIFAELDVISFPEAGDALQYAKANDISLFILDIQLEDYKGTNLAKQLRELPEYKYTPIIFETALAGEELSAYRDVKCYSFLVKPFGEAIHFRICCTGYCLYRSLWEKTCDPYHQPSVRYQRRYYFWVHFVWTIGIA